METKRKPPVHGTPATAEEIIAIGTAYLAGATGPMLAQRFGRTVGSVDHIIKQNGFLKKDHPDAVYCWRGTEAFEASRAWAIAAAAEAEAAGPKPAKRAAYRIRGQATSDLARAAYLDGWTAARVAAHFGLSVSALRKRAAREGWRKADLPDATEPMGPAPREELERGASRLKAGMTRGAVVLHGHQRPPEGDWGTWLVLGGRGAGKTLAGASWVADRAEALGAGGRIALIGATLHDVREVMIEGPSGLKRLGRWATADGGWDGPVYEPSRRRLRFPGGAEAYAFSAEEPDRLRGPQFHCGWADEFCAWAPGKGVGDALAMLRLGLRLEGRGEAETPQLVVTTTPRPTRALKGLMAEAGVVVTRAGTGANAAHLAAGFVEGLKALYGGTRLEAQEIEGQVIDDGLSLWSAPMLAACRGEGGAPYDRVVVGVDPSVTADGHACGVVVVARQGTRAWVLADRTVRGLSPEGWAKSVVQAAADFGATTVVVEVNQGGELVTGLLRAVGAGLEIKGVRASVGKRARAEPVAALYEQGRVLHAGTGLERLEEELMAFGHEGEGAVCDLDRADALVWAVTHLLLGTPAGMPRVRATGGVAGS